jgi:hypothetical protein
VSKHHTFEPSWEERIVRKELFCMLLVLLGLGSLAHEDVSASETVTYSGVGTFVANRSTLPLANGAAAFQLANDVVATIAPSEFGVLYGDCAGLGYADAKGQYSARAFCTFAETETDGFVIDASVEPGVGGTVKIIGGSGKWAGATGDGILEAKADDGYGGSYSYEFRITTP